MGFWDSFGGDGLDFWSGFGDSGILDSGGGGSDVWGLDWGNLFGDGGLDFGGGGGGGSSSGGGILSSLFGGGSGSGIFGSLLSGLGAGAAAALSGKDLKESIGLKGEQDRLTLADQNKYSKEQIALQALEGRHGIDFEAALKDYYGQQDKRRKRIALDTYGQFSTINKIKPGYVNTPFPETPSKPGYT